jgi:hypothetical protein
MRKQFNVWLTTTAATSMAILTTLGAGQAKAGVIDFSQVKGLDDFSTTEMAFDARRFVTTAPNGLVRFVQTDDLGNITTYYTNVTGGTTTVPSVITNSGSVATFSNVGRTVSAPGGGTMVSSQDTSTIAGGYRVLTFPSLNGLNVNNRGSKATVGGGTLSLSNDTAVNGDLQLWYDGNGDKTFGAASGTLAYDLTKNAKGQSGVLTGVWIELVNADLGLNNLTLNIYDKNGVLRTARTATGTGTSTTLSTYTGSGTPVLNPTASDIANASATATKLLNLGVDANNPLVDQTGRKGFYFDFVKDFGAPVSDFTAIKSLMLTVDSKSDGDTQISFLGGSLAPVESIPESNLSWLTLAGLSVVGALSFKRK